MDSSDEEFFASSNTVDFITNKQREYSVHPINQNRREDGEFYRLYSDLREFPEKFRSYTRMDMETFDFILDMIKAKLLKDWTNFNKQPIFPCERLIVTLRHLATGSSYTTHGFSFRMGRATVAAIVRETCQVLWEVLQPIYMPPPTEQMFRTVAEGFWTRWNFPNCVGAIDGKHIRIQCPAGAGSLYYNYKQYHSIVLQAVADSNCKFLMVEVGGYGKQSDGGTFNASDMFRMMNEGTLNVPPVTALPDPDLPTKMPHVFVGDEVKFVSGMRVLQPTIFQGEKLRRMRFRYNEQQMETLIEID
nr:protein ANTAGONIST OF LIKE HETEROCHROMATIN PROTEIN 1-like [Aedes albopictus]